MTSPRSIQVAALTLLGVTMIVAAAGVATVKPEPEPIAVAQAPRAPAAFGHYSLQ